MADQSLKELQEKRVELGGEIKGLAERQDDWTAEERTKWDEINAEYDSVIESIEQIEERQSVLDRLDKVKEHDDQIKTLRRTTVGERRAQRDGAISVEQRSLALQGWLRQANDLPLKPIHEEACAECKIDFRSKKLDVGMRPYSRAQGFSAWDSRSRPMFDEFNEWRAEQRDLGTTPGDVGGYTIPEGFVYELERVLLAFGGPRRVCRIYSTASGNPMPWPVVDDTGNTGELLAEAGDIGTSVDPVFSQVAFGAYKYSSKPVLISQELLEDSAFNMALLLAELLGERIGRIQANHFTLGTGTGQPTGLVTASKLGVTAAAAATIDADELIDLQGAIDPAYESLPSVGWMMNKTTRTAVRKLKDTTNQYLWQPGLRFGEPDMLLGRPITTNQDMPDIAASAKPILYGGFEKYVIRDAAALRFYRLEELYRQNDLTGFVAFRRSDGQCINTNAILHLVMAAS